MKKTNFKKALSLFMAVMMLVSCWVFVAPSKAEAANVSYPVTIRFKINSSSVSGHINVYYFPFKADGSGFDTTQTNLYKTVISSFGGAGYNQGGTTYNAGPFDITEGWPWKVEIRVVSTTVRFLGFYINGVETTGMVAGGDGYDINGTITKHWAYNDNDNLGDKSTPYKNWPVPEPTTISTMANISYEIPKIGTGTEGYFTRSVSVKDQYGIEWPVPADYTLSKTTSTNGGAPGEGIWYDAGTNRVYVNEAAQKLKPNTASSTYYLIASKGSKSTYLTINLTHPKYTVTFNNANGQQLQSLQYYYGASVTAPTSPVKNPDNTYHYAFTGWDTSDYNYVERDITVNPQYSFATHNFNGSYVTSNGAHARRCSGCSMTGIGTTGGVTEPCTGVWTGNGGNVTHTKTCNTCKNVESHSPSTSDWLEIADEKYIKTPATCTSPAVYYDSCAICGLAHTYNTFTSGTASEHNFTVKVSETPHTCTEDGYVTYKCANCNATTDKYEDDNGALLDPAAHTWADGLSEKDENNHGKVCTVCNAAWTEEAEHSWKLTDTLIAPTCTEKGSGTESCECGATRATEIPATGHQDTKKVEAKDATCTEGGYTAGTYCNDCETWIEGHEVIESEGHKLVATTANDPTCEEDGNIAYWTCSACDKIYSDAEAKTEIKLKDTVIEALGHEYDSEVTKEPTCITAGVKTYTCKNDASHTYTEVINATGEHVYGEWVQFNNGTTHRRTCTADADCGAFEEENHAFTGAIRHIEGENFHDFKCAKCEAYGTQANGMNFKEACYDSGNNYDNKTATTHTAYCVCGNAVVETHVWAGWKADPENTTDGEGKMTNTCSECDYVWESDCNYEEIEDVASTCTVQGYTTYKCEDCSNGYTVRKELANHKYETYVSNNDATCQKNATETAECAFGCGEEDTREIADSKVAHKYENYVSNDDATCQKNATETAECAYGCGEKDTKEIANSTVDHKYETYVSNNDATCQKNATETAECAFGCGEEDTKEIANSTVDHKYETYVSNDDATCQKNATETAECAFGCGEKDTKEIANSTVDHKYETYVSNNDATCQKNATETAECAFGCGEEDTREIADSKVAHKYENYVSNDDATCQKNATETAECAYGCGEKDTKEIANSTVDHKYETYVSNNDATCQKNATETAECAFGCGEKDTKEIANSTVDHKYETYVSNNDATCQKNATETAECAFGCGEEDTREIADSKVAHKYENYVSNDDATCQKNATETAECAYGCGEKDTKEIANSTVDHKYETYVSNNDATCQKNATETAECAYGCGEEDTRKIADSKVAHTPAEAVIENEVEATCKAEGSYDEVVYCSECNTELSRETKAIEKLAHTEETIPAVDTTCKEPGLTAGKKCSVCGEILVAQEVVDKLDHTPAEVVIENEVAATCKADGSYDEVVYCSVCGEEISRDTITIPAIADNHTPAEAVIENKVDATSCKEPGSYDEVVYCSVCGEELSRETITTESIPHTWGIKQENRIEATCEYDGSYIEIDYCTKCDLEFNRRTVTIPALPHNYYEEPGRDATCSEYGYSSYRQCLDCGYIDGKVIYPVTEHTDENGDGICDDCNVKLDGEGAFVCVCICHTTNWFLRIIQTIVRWFWKIFGVNRVCACGSYHY